jgi:hypothetical protein
VAAEGVIKGDRDRTMPMKEGVPLMLVTRKTAIETYRLP